MRYFYIFEEMNDNEGETWRFCVPESAENREALDAILERVGELGFEDSYYELEDIISSDDLNVIMRWCYYDTSYMASWHKLEGTIILPENFLELDEEGLDRLLYKGGLRKLMRDD